MKFKTVLASLIAGYCLGVLFLTVHTYIQNYNEADGFVFRDGKPIGGDFVCFYAAGKLVREDIKNVYDFQAQFAKQREILKGAENLDLGPYQFVYPPLMAFLFSLLSPFSFSAAYKVWVAVSVLFYISGLIILMKGLSFGRQAKLLIFLAAVSFVPFSIDCLAGGQTSCLGFFIFALVFLFLKSGKDTLAGIVLAFSYYKPPLFLVFIVFTLLRRRWKVVTGFTVTLAALVALSFLFFGPDIMAEYFERAGSNMYGKEIIPGYKLPVQKGVSLLPLLHQIFSNRAFINPVFIGVSVFLIFLAFFATRKSESVHRNSRMFDLIFVLDVSLSLFLSPYMMVYDLTIVMIPMIIIWAHCLTGHINVIKRTVLLLSAGFFAEFLLRSISISFVTIQTPVVLLALWSAGLLILVSRKEMNIQ